MNDHKYIEMPGFIVPPFNKENRKHANTGWFIDFNFESAGKIHPCRIWDSVADSCSNILEATKPLLLIGYLNGIQLRVKSVRERVTSKYQTDKEQARKSFEAKVSSLARRNIHPASRDGKIMFCHDCYIIRRNGSAVSKIDFCMDILGEKYVVKALRDSDLVTVKEGLVKVGPQIRNRYLSTLNRLTKEALDFENVPF